MDRPAPHRMKLRITLLHPALACCTMMAAQSGADAALRAAQTRYDAFRLQLDSLHAELDRAKLAVMAHDLTERGLPALKPGETVVMHPGHALVWDELHHLPKWTAHLITPDIAQGNLARIDTFLPDPMVNGNTALHEAYWNSGYDRGHMVPSADMRWNKEALLATYMYSNVSPQKPELNRGTWSDMEDWTRRYVHYSGHRVFVVTAPVPGPDMPLLGQPGATRVSIPPAFVKAVADLDGPEKQGIAFVMRNGLNDQGLLSYAISIDSAEALTGLDLFPALADTLEARVEAQHNAQAWYGEGDRAAGEVAPLPPPLPGGRFNTMQARYHVGSTATICGTVVNTRRASKSNALYLNFDRMYPNQDFYATVWDYNGPNFAYDPETWLLGRKVCVTGKVTLFDDIARISINNGKEITFWEDVLKEK
jgi:DNA/RNA endonuclease G (NUC1)